MLQLLLLVGNSLHELRYEHYLGDGMKNFILSISVVLGMSVSGMAGGNYGAAGCGPGAMVMGADGNQFLAAFVNDGMFLSYVPNLASVGSLIASLKTFAISSGTMNCTDDGVALEDKESEQFVESNYELLKQDVAQGEGENLNAFTYMMGCNAEGAGVLSNRMQQNYTDLFSSEKANAGQVIQGVKEMIQSDDNLNQMCLDGAV